MLFFNLAVVALLSATAVFASEPEDDRPAFGIVRQPDHLGVSPTITAAPLLARDLGPDDDICGYESMAYYEAHYCQAPYVCAFNRGARVYGCCHANSLAACELATSCFAHSKVLQCSTRACPSSRSVTTCNSRYPLCDILYSISGVATFSYYSCNTRVSAWIQSIYSTYTDGPIVTSTPVIPRITTSSSSSSSSSSSTSSDPVVVPPSPPPVPNPSPPIPEPVQVKSTPTGAIVGGVVGGVLGLAILLFLGIVGWRKGWFKKSKPQEPVAVILPHHLPPPHPLPPPHHSGPPFGPPPVEMAMAQPPAPMPNMSELPAYGTKPPTPVHVNQPMSPPFSQASSPPVSPTFGSTDVSRISMPDPYMMR